MQKITQKLFLRAHRPSSKKSAASAKHRPLIISFSGVDCSGKSTQIALLKAYFESLNKSVKVFWYRPGYSKELELIKSTIRKPLKPFISQANAKAKSKANVCARNKFGLKSSLWLATALIDTFTQWSIKLRLLSRRYDVVIADRYIDDAALDLSNKYPNSFRFGRILNAMSLFFPNLEQRILLMISHETMLRRMELKQEPFPDSEKARDMRYAAYEMLAKSGRYVVVDGELSAEKVHELIIAELSARGTI
ncbi:MAG: hypothetical protein WC966_04000 [Bradymonadales bacterium]|jgi:thymidylate kinase